MSTYLDIIEKVLFENKGYISRYKIKRKLGIDYSQVIYVNNALKRGILRGHLIKKKDSFRLCQEVRNNLKKKL